MVGAKLLMSMPDDFGLFVLPPACVGLPLLLLQDGANQGGIFCNCHRRTWSFSLHPFYPPLYGKEKGFPHTRNAGLEHGLWTIATFAEEVCQT